MSAVKQGAIFSREFDKIILLIGPFVIIICYEIAVFFSRLLMSDFYMEIGVSQKFR